MNRVELTDEELGIVYHALIDYNPPPFVKEEEAEAIEKTICKVRHAWCDDEPKLKCR